MEIEMTIEAIAIDPVTKMPVVLLKDAEGKMRLPIWIGLLEASAIAMELEGIQAPRPMTHDLLCNMIKELGAKVKRILVCDLEDNTYYARIFLEVGDKVVDIDARPSDSMAIALRVKAPIFVDEVVIENSQTVEVKADWDPNDKEKMKELLGKLSPEDFGKYKM